MLAHPSLDQGQDRGRQKKHDCNHCGQQLGTEMLERSPEHSGKLKKLRVPRLGTLIIASAGQGRT